MTHPATAAARLELFQILHMLNKGNIPGDGVVEQVRNLLRRNERLEEQMAEAARVTDYARLLGMLDEDRSEVLMLLADACQDCGRPEEAPGWYWLGEKRKWPMQAREGWVWSPEYGLRDSRSGCLPGHLYAILDPVDTDVEQFFDSCSQAIQAVVDVIASGRWKPTKKPSG